MPMAAPGGSKIIEFLYTVVIPGFIMGQGSRQTFPYQYD